MPKKLIKFSGEKESFLADTYKKTGIRKGTESQRVEVGAMKHLSPTGWVRSRCKTLTPS